MEDPLTLSGSGIFTSIFLRRGGLQTTYKNAGGFLFMSEWIKLHTELIDHPKLHRFTALIGVERTTAIGHLNCLWIFTLRYAWRDANLERFGDIAIAKGCLWNGDPKLFIESLQTSGFLDGYIVHDWHDYAGKLVSDRLYNETKRRKTPLNVVKRPKSRVEKSSVVKSSEDKSNTTTTAAIDIKSSGITAQQTEWFEKLWPLYPQKGRIGKKMALKHFLASVPDLATARRCEIAINRYKDSKRVLSGFVQNASTFFNNWPDWEHYREEKDGTVNC